MIVLKPNHALLSSAHDVAMHICCFTTESDKSVVMEWSFVGGNVTVSNEKLLEIETLRPLIILLELAQK